MARACSDAPRRSAADLARTAGDQARRGAGSSASRWPATRSTRAEPTTAASAMRAIAAACAGVADAEADRDRQVACGAGCARPAARDRVGHGRRVAGDAGDRDIIDEAAWCCASTAGRRASSVVGRGQADEVEPGRPRRQAQLVILLGRQVDHDQPVDAGRLGIGAGSGRAIGVDRVVVAHQHDRRRRRRPRGTRRTSSSVAVSVMPAGSARRPTPGSPGRRPSGR